MDVDVKQKLIEQAKSARLNAYAPYSNFKVGAALLTSDGQVFKGCNIENISFSLTNCAERTALFSAIAKNEKNFTAMAIVTADDNLSSPCGACLQVISEFVDPKFPIILANLNNKVMNLTMQDLLPLPFTPNSQIGKGNQ